MIEIFETVLHEVVTFLKLIVEGIAIVIIVVSVAKVLPKVIRFYLISKNKIIDNSIRIELGISLALALEFLLAADILGTAISPSWEGVGILAATSGIRTFLNFFLEREVKELEKKKR
ncbi:MAG: DUF1622 domain-containing protein [Prochloraceae cyanobacterium]